jgi:hypothetical protein
MAKPQPHQGTKATPSHSSHKPMYTKYMYNNSLRPKHPPKTPPLLLLMLLRASFTRARHRSLAFQARTRSRAIRALRSMKAPPSPIRRKRRRCLRSLRSIPRGRRRCAGSICRKRRRRAGSIWSVVREVYGMARPRRARRKGACAGRCDWAGRCRGRLIWVGSRRTVLFEIGTLADTSNPVSGMHIVR